MVGLEPTIYSLEGYRVDQLRYTDMTNANVGNRTRDDSLEESHDTTSPRTLVNIFNVVIHDNSHAGN